ncbi:cytochrome P450 [Xylaria cf. heliscus]|nr:cytochrome P450 [Xylaria cf. heliscus]
MLLANLSNSSAVVVTASLLLTLYSFFIRSAYPLPLPGIPYNFDTARRLLGDITEIAESAVTQAFLGPFIKETITVSKYHEINDVLNHRDAVDFKRAPKLIPSTFDPNFNSSRNLAKDLITPSILNGLTKVNAPRIYDVAYRLLHLWRIKSRLAVGRPFDVVDDVSEFSFDAIVGAAMGLEPQGGDIQHQYKQLAKHDINNSSASTIDVDLDANLPVTFPVAPRSAKLAALLVDEESLRQSFLVPWPRLFHLLNNLRPSVRRSRRILREYIASQITQAVPGLSDGTRDPQCALDYVIQREVRAAATENRPPALSDPRILEPIYGYLLAGHDTSSGSLLWLIRRLVTHPEQQYHVRESLRLTYPEAWSERRLPTVTALIKTQSPHLNAFIEETLRCDTPVANIMVMTRHDTTILGHQVPRDTRVFLNLTGPSISQQSVPVTEADRQTTSRVHKPVVGCGTWDMAAPEEFRPERWLREGPGSTVVFDPAAGPTLAFSAGNRGCWGKRLGYLELRIVLALLIWSFDFSISEKYSNWETVDSLVSAPKTCIVRIREILHE